MRYDFSKDSFFTVVKCRVELLKKSTQDRQESFPQQKVNKLD